MKWLTDSLKKMDKTKWMIVGLSGILLLVIALPTDSGRKKQELALQAKEPDTSRQAQANAYQKQLANEMEQALGCMDGVGKVRVMITFQDSGENVVEKDVTKSANGLEGSQPDSQYQEATVYQEALYQPAEASGGRRRAGRCTGRRGFEDKAGNFRCCNGIVSDTGA